MTNWQRTFAFVSGALVFGLLFIIISNSFIQYVANPGTTGYLFLFGFGLIFLNLNFGISRRFAIKALNPSGIAYLMALLTIVPTIFWVYTKDVGLAELQLVFVLTVIFSAFLGAYFGIRRGAVKRQQYIQRLRDEKQDIPESLKRPHDDLSKN
ncbi:hypothetical protein [Fodinibius sp.]|uniref:hypothetical protein n=1 Tax=Fodinibius sp. TaxID=1872440 RepID=UPI002ACEDACD|nr:hypothetical protein [Fodinibius sp.]MDZ7658676.1 hypothetical protein [Fodinibius sp.]